MTTSIESPKWNDGGFVDPIAQKYWLELPDNLKQIAVAEFDNGNEAREILKNEERNIVLLSFTKRPISAAPIVPKITVHTSHSYGNYCYDGTACTYEDNESGCFLAFEDPKYNENAF